MCVAGAQYVGQYNEVMHALSKLGFSTDDVAAVHSLIAAVLHLGDVSFKSGANVCTHAWMHGWIGWLIG